MTTSDNGSELVFVYGTLRRGGSNAFRMDGAEFVGEGFVRGKLYAISWYPGLVVEDGAGEVRGDVFRVGSDLLIALDEFEGLSAGEIEGSEYRRVITRVYLHGVSTDEGIEAWAYEWIGSVDESTRILSGDWMDVVQPKPAPLFSSLGIVLAIAAVLNPFLYWRYDQIGIMLLLWVGAPVAGVISIWVAIRRRERMSILRTLALWVCVLLLVALVFFVAK